MAIPLIVVMIEARMRRIRLQGTPLPPPAVPRIQVQVITVVAVGVNMSACGKSCFIVQMLYGQGSNAFKHFYFGTLYLLFVLPVRTKALTSVAHTKRISVIYLGYGLLVSISMGMNIFFFIFRACH